ncbi:PQQ-binding-like beta-propeller repeat protein [Spirillospora sp. NPDC000708]
MPEPAVHPEEQSASPSSPPPRGLLRRLGDRRRQSRGLPESVRRLPAADRAAVARAVRRCVPPPDPALDEPTLASSRYVRDQMRRYAWLYRWPPVALVAVSAVMLAATRTEQMAGTTVVLIGVAVLSPASAARRRGRLERLETAIRARGQDGTPAPEPRRRVRVPSPATAAIAAGMLLVASGLWLQWDAHHRRNDWTIDGPHGAFPETIATQPPQHPRKAVAAYPYPALTYRGLAIEATRNSGSVTARRIRPAATYWRLARRDHRLLDADIDPATGRLLLVWAHLDPDTGATEAPLQAMAVDVRTGSIRWTRTLSTRSDVLDQGSTVIGRAALIPAEGVTVLDPATGHRRWRLHDGCEEAPGGTLGGTVILRRECPGTGLLVEGYNAAAGHLLWSMNFARWWPGREHAAVLPVRVAGLDRNRIVVWTLEREAVYDATTGAELGEHPQPVDADGKVLGAGENKVFDGETGYGPCWIAPPRDLHEGICATDPVTGRRLWSFRFPGAAETPQLGSPVAVADGRVYTLTSDHGGEIVDHVNVNDARTGALLARVSPALPRPDHVYGIRAAADGALVLTDDLVPTPTPNKTVVLGDG